MNRRAFLALIGCAATMSAAGCAGGGEGRRPGELVWATGKITAEGPGRHIVDAWNRQHPSGPRVRVVSLPQDADNQRALLALELNAGIGQLDVLDLDAPWTAEFASKGWLVDMDDLRPLVHDLSLPAAAATCLWEGTLWGVPFTTDAGMLYYRSDLVEKPPRSWPELVEVGNRVADQWGVAPFVSDGVPSEGLVVQYLEYLRAAGGDLTVDGDGVRLRDGAGAREEETVAHDCAPREAGDQAEGQARPGAATEALTFMRDCYRTGFYGPGFDTLKQEDARNTFQSGEAVFLRSWPYAYRLMNGQDPASQVVGKVGIAALPTFTGEGVVAMLGGHNLAVNRYSSDVESARKFVRFATTDRGVQHRLADLSMAPALRSVYTDRRADPLIAFMGDQVIPAARARPTTPYWSDISQEVKQQVFAAYTGKAEPGDVVASIRCFLRAAVHR